MNDPIEIGIPTDAEKVYGTQAAVLLIARLRQDLMKELDRNAALAHAGLELEKHAAALEASLASTLRQVEGARFQANTYRERLVALTAMCTAANQEIARLRVDAARASDLEIRIQDLEIRIQDLEIALEEAREQAAMTRLREDVT